MLHKLLINIIILMAVVVFFNSNTFENWYNASACEFPIKYHIGFIDERFGITSEKLEKHIMMANAIWSNEYGKELFVFDEESHLDFNIVYDGRQQLVTGIGDSTGKAENDLQSIQGISKEYEAKRQSVEHEIEVLNDEIAYWNEQGGAPSKIYNYLNEKRDQLSKKIEQLNNMAILINIEIVDYNNQVDSINQMVADFNLSLNEHPEMGLYTSGKESIDIFFYASDDELTHVLAHEMGHALGLEHVLEEDAIMNPTASDNINLTHADKKELEKFCKNNNRINVYIKNLRSLLFPYREYVTQLLSKVELNIF